jgi:hypothetical protein
MTEQQQPEKQRFTWLRANIDVSILIGAILVVPIALRLLSHSNKYQLNFWGVALWLYCALAIISFVPVWRAARRKVAKKDIDASLAQAKETITKARPL